MAKKILHYKVYLKLINLFLCSVVAFLIPLEKKIVPLAISTWLIIWLFEADFMLKIKRIQNFVPYAAMILFFLLHAVFIINSEDVSEALHDLEVKLSLLIFPIIFALKNFWYRQKKDLILKAFLAGNVLACVVCFVRAVYRHLILHQTHFSYSEYSYFHHTSYFSMYLLFSLLIIYHLYKTNRLKTKIEKIFALVCALFFISTIILLSSKAGVIALFLVSSAILFKEISRILKTKLLIIISLLILIGFAATVSLNSRFQSAFRAVVNYKADEVSNRESTNARIFLLKSSFDIIADNFWFGVGTGDIKHELLARSKQFDPAYSAEKQLNPHNQFLETFIGQGFFGFATLVFIFVYSLIFAFRKRNRLFFFFLLITAFNFMFESMLNTLAGIVFFAFFYNYFADNSNFQTKISKIS